MRWAGHLTRLWEKKNICIFLMGKPEGKRPLGRPQSRWEDNIKVVFKEIGWDGMAWHAVESSGSGYGQV
jgi:hypothetical protein